MPTNVFDMLDTWNNGSTVFNGIKMNVNRVASAAGSRLLDVQTNGVSQFAVDPALGTVVGEAAGGGKGLGTINATGYYVNGVAIGAGGASVVDEIVVSLVDGTTVPVDASLGNVFHLIALGSRIILAPSNAPIVGRTQKIVIRHEASGGSRLLSLTTGSAGSFRFGTSVGGLTTTVSGQTDYIGCIWDQVDARWDVVSYSKGY